MSAFDAAVLFAAGLVAFLLVLTVAGLLARIIDPYGDAP